MSRRSTAHAAPNATPIVASRKPDRRSPKPAFLLKSLIALVLTLTLAASAQTKPRARDLGVPFDGTPGPNNAITDVKGVEVGHTTLITGSGKLVVGKGPVRTGVTAIHPRGKTQRRRLRRLVHPQRQR